jgi:hypothetical protein
MLPELLTTLLLLAVYDRTLRSWNVVLDKGEFEFLPDEFFSRPGDWAGGE